MRRLPLAWAAPFAALVLGACNQQAAASNSAAPSAAESVAVAAPQDSVASPPAPLSDAALAAPPDNGEKWFFYDGPEVGCWALPGMAGYWGLPDPGDDPRPETIMDEIGANTGRVWTYQQNGAELVATSDIGHLYFFQGREICKAYASRQEASPYAKRGAAPPPPPPPDSGNTADSN
jgi:hypothetical protein